jgi:hypothetical protein
MSGQITLHLQVAVGSDIVLVTSERFDPLPRGQVATDADALAEGASLDAEAEAVRVVSSAEDSEDEAVDGREEAVQRARRSAARAVIAADKRLGVVTPQELYDVAGPDEDSSSDERPRWWARRFGGASGSA